MPLRPQLPSKCFTTFCLRRSPRLTPYICPSWHSVYQKNSTIPRQVSQLSDGQKNQTPKTQNFSQPGYETQDDGYLNLSAAHARGSTGAESGCLNLEDIISWDEDLKSDSSDDQGDLLTIDGHAKKQAETHSLEFEKSFTKPILLGRRARFRYSRVRNKARVAKSTKPSISTKTAGLLHLKTFRFSPTCSRWSERFALVCRRRPRKTISTKIQQWLIKSTSAALIQKKWKRIGPRRRSLLWPGLMYNVMGSHQSPTVLRVLMGTYMERLPPSHLVSPTVDYIVQQYLRNQDSTDHNRAEFLLNCINELRSRGPQNHIKLSQSSIYSLIANLSPSSVHNMYLDLLDQKHPLSALTLGHFADRLARSTHIPNALDLLWRIKSQRGDFTSSGLLGLCSTILQKKYRAPEYSLTDSEVLNFMLSDCGMEPNHFHYNILIHNSLQSGDHQAGWQIYNTMLKSGLGADACTYSILLNDAKWRMDRSAIENIMGCVREKDIKNAHIVTDLLHTILLLHRQEKSLTKDTPSPPRTSTTAFDRMLPVYSIYFNLKPLFRLIPHFQAEYYPDIKRATEKPDSNLPGDGGAADSTEANSIPITSPTVDLIEPPHASLCLMLASLLEGVQSPHYVRRIYKHFNRLVSKGDPVVASLLDTTHVYDLFLMAFGNFQGCLYDCIELVRFMLFSNAGDNHPKSSYSHPEEQMLTPQNVFEVGHSTQTIDPQLTSQDSEYVTFYAQGSSSSPQVKTKRHPHRPPKPSVYTWSILLNIFMKQRHTKSAEKVLWLMESRGVKPNIVTWEHLVNGYARRMQDPAMAADAVHRLEEAGFQPDENIMDSLKKVRDREQLVNSMKRSRTRGKAQRMMDHVLDQAMLSEW